MDLVQALRALLADVVTFYFQAHGYHWNVEGPDFSQYHALFGDIYGDVYGSIDPLAENLRKLDAYAPFTLGGFIKLRSLEDSQVSPDPRSMAQDLMEANAQVLDALNDSFAAANEANEQGIANFLAERIDAHQKWAWFLRSSLKG
jgi:starvation-inducible DNA-binding protein